MNEYNDFISQPLSAKLGGIGIDMTDLSRFEKLSPNIRERMAKRILADSEQTEYERSTNAAKIHYLARAFCVKEAVGKALSCGIFALDLRQIELKHSERGKPFLDFSGELAKAIKVRGYGAAHISITHEKNFVLALVILERADE